MSIQVSLVYQNEHGIRGNLTYGFPKKIQGEFALQVGYAGYSWQCPPQTLAEAKRQAREGHDYSLRLDVTEMLALQATLVGRKCPYARFQGSTYVRGCVLTEEMVKEIGQDLFALKEIGWDWIQRIDPIRQLVLNRLQMEYQANLKSPRYGGTSILIKVLPSSDKVEECSIEISPEIAMELAQYLTLAAHRALPTHLVEIASLTDTMEES